MKQVATTIDGAFSMALDVQCKRLDAAEDAGEAPALPAPRALSPTTSWSTDHVYRPVFLPSTHGFAFTNRWPAVPLIEINGPLNTKIPIGSASNGLCGGMAFAAADYFERGLSRPNMTSAPGEGTPVYRYIVDRLLDSFEMPGGPFKYYDWMITDDHDTSIGPFIRRGLAWRTIRDELPRICADIDGGRLSPLGVVTVRSEDPFKLGKNHQVLCYGYDVSGSKTTLRVYDPNRPLSDSVFLSLDTSHPSNTTYIDHNLGLDGPVRGFFRLNRSLESPPCERPDLSPGKYGSWVKLRHIASSHRLHSHAFDYGHARSSRQQQVTCFVGADDNDWWRVRVEHGASDHDRRGQRVRNGDVVRLEHVLTGRNLHSHSGHPSPVTRQQEVTCFGEHGVGDGNDNWRLEIEDGSEWLPGLSVRLVHVNTGHGLHSHGGYAHPAHTRGQQEVTCFPWRDDNDWWVLENV